VLRSTDTAFKALHIAVPGAQILKTIEMDVNGDGIPDKVVVATGGNSERDKIDRRSLDVDILRAREAAVEYQKAGELLSPSSPVSPVEGLGPRKGRSASIVSVTDGATGRPISVHALAASFSRDGVPQLSIQYATVKRTAVE
jgi:hypothetical protein